MLVFIILIVLIAVIGGSGSNRDKCSMSSYQESCPDCGMPTDNGEMCDDCISIFDDELQEWN